MMNALRTVRYVSWALVFIAVFVIGTTMLGLRFHYDKPTSPPQATLPSDAIGGPFTMVDHTGRTVTEQTFAGRPFILFFGFTHCPDICPTTLSWLSDLVERATAEGNRPPLVFVTVDPERDTPEALAAYIPSFGPGIVGLTGSPQQLETMANAWKVYFKKVPIEGGGYTMDHSASIFLMDADGKFRGTLDLHDATRDNNLKKVKSANKKLEALETTALQRVGISLNLFIQRPDASYGISRISSSFPPAPVSRPPQAGRRHGTTEQT